MILAHQFKFLAMKNFKNLLSDIVCLLKNIKMSPIASTELIFKPVLGKIRIVRFFYNLIILEYNCSLWLIADLFKVSSFSACASLFSHPEEMK